MLQVSASGLRVATDVEDARKLFRLVKLGIDFRHRYRDAHEDLPEEGDYIGDQRRQPALEDDQDRRLSDRRQPRQKGI